MKKFFKFLAYCLLILLLFCALAGAGYWAIAIKGWPWWIAVVLAASVFGAVLAVIALKKFLIRKNEKKFVQSVINEAPGVSEPGSPDLESGLKQAEAQWKESIAKLKKSHLRRFGNPVYVLPWYMIMGESRSGKTSAIKNSNLSSALTDVSESTIVAGTQNCDWWFLEQAVVLDTAGRYTIPIEEEKDKKEWTAFLTLLAKYRKKEPINGVIVTAAADSILNEDNAVLSAKAKSIRQRINQMMRILGARFPVYLLVTKMDLVNGFTDFCDHIPDHRYDQVMGYANHDAEPDGLKILDKCMTSVFEQIRGLRSLFVHNRLNNFAVSFSNEFMKLGPGLEAYVNELFGKDIYQSTPLLRGIYFSSATRQGSPGSDFLSTTGISYSNDAAPGRNKGFFLRSFFNALLPKDRNVFKPLTEFIMWRRTTLSLTIFALCLLCLAMSGVLAFSYVNNLKALETIDPTVFKHQASADGPGDTTREQVLYFDRIRSQIRHLEAANKNWLLPRFGLHHSLELEKKLKQSFVKDVKTRLIDPLDDKFFDRVTSRNWPASDEEIVNDAIYAVNRINILVKAAGDQNLPDIKPYVKSMGPVLPDLDPQMSLATLPYWAAVHFAWQQWNNDQTASKKKLGQFHKILSRIALNNNIFEWLVSPWVCPAKGVGLSTLLKGYQINADMQDRKTDVKGAFTQTGRRQIKDFINMLAAASQDKQAFAHREGLFWQWYAKQFYKAWYDFAATFPSADQWKAAVDNWLDLGTLMTTPGNPYFQLLETMGKEFEWFRSQPELKVSDFEPAWAKTIIIIKDIKTLAKTEQEKEKGSILAKLSLTKEKISDALDSSPDKVLMDAGVEENADLEFKMQLADVWNTYLENLATLSAAGSYTEKCFQMFSDLFKALSDPGKATAPYNLTYDSLVKLDTFLRANNSSPVIYRIVKGPYDYMTAYGICKSTIYLQKKWEEIVLSAALSTDPEKYYATMFDRTSGVVWQYVNDEAGAFINQTKNGFASQKAFGLRLPFSNSFLKLLNKGEQLKLEKQDQYAVTLTTLPSSVNNDAKIRPYSTTLLMNCAEEKTSLLNTNFPETQTFVWKPDTCGDVYLAIQFGDSWLEQAYKGRLGFAKFLYDFKDGTHTYFPTDFPEYKGFLVNNKVTRIDVAYDIEGLEPVLEFLERRPPTVPDLIFTRYVSKKGKFPLSQKELERLAQQHHAGTGNEALADKYAVILETLPMDVNTSAIEKPSASIFTLECKNEVIKFENMNYPDSISFDWEPDSCGKVLIYINFSKFTLVKEYPDFLEFAKDFKFHSKTLFSKDFPGQETEFEKIGLISITLSYIFSGELPKLDTGEKANLTLSGSMPKPAQESRSLSPPRQPDQHQAQPENTDKQNTQEQASLVPGTTAQSPAVTTRPGHLSIRDEAWISSQQINNFTIQVIMGHEKSMLEQFARDNGLKGDAAVFRKRLNGKNTYCLVLGSFDSYAKARQQMNSLSASASKDSPWIRRFGSIIMEMQQD